jgi:hypothetical protein
LESRATLDLQAGRRARLLAAVNATRLTLDPVRHVLVAGTEGSGAWTLAVP